MPWVKTLDLRNGEISSTDECVTDVAVQETSLQVYPPATVLVAMYGGFNQIGRTGLLRIPACVNQALSAIQVNRNRVVPEYLLAVLNYRVAHWKAVASSSRKDPNITGNDVRAFELPLPPIEEQRSIAAALSDVDALLTKLDQLVAKKRDLKEAAMEQLLTGRRRLSGFAGPWPTARIEELADVDPSALPSGTSQNFAFNYISLEDVDRGSLNAWSEQTFATAPSRARRLLKPQDVLVSTVRPNLQSHLLFAGGHGDWVCSTGFAVLRAKPGRASPRFLFECLFSSVVTRQIESMLTGSNYPAINSGDVRRLVVPAPEYDEQAAIASVLADMGAEIAALEARGEKTRQLKQGMMQALLTGRIRLV